MKQILQNNIDLNGEGQFARGHARPDNAKYDSRTVQPLDERFQAAWSYFPGSGDGKAGVHRLSVIQPKTDGTAQRAYMPGHVRVSPKSGKSWVETTQGDQKHYEEFLTLQAAKISLEDTASMTAGMAWMIRDKDGAIASALGLAGSTPPQGGTALPAPSSDGVQSSDDMQAMQDSIAQAFSGTGITRIDFAPETGPVQHSIDIPPAD